MGLFSFLSKNKQDRTAQDSGRFTRAEDDAIAQRARAKRASHAGEGARRGRDGKGADDPVLPEKKRARRRLVGAIALALASAVGLPMLLDSAPPKPLPGDIAIEIPSKDKAAPLPMPSEPEGAPQAVAAADSVDKGEEIVEPAKAARAAKDPQAVAEVHTAAVPAKTEPSKAETKPEPKPEHKPAPKASEPKPAEKVAEKPAPKKLEEKPAAKKPDEKPAHSQPPADTERALAILEGKQAGKAGDAGEKVTIQVAALGSAEKAAELQAKLRAAGIHSFTEKVERPGGALIRVKVGPYGKDEADKVRARLARLK